LNGQIGRLGATQNAINIVGAPTDYVREIWPGQEAPLSDAFARVEKVGETERKRGPLLIETYALHLLQGPKGEVFDRAPPPELK